VSIPLYKADGFFGDPLEWWKRNQLKYPYLARLALCRTLTLKRANLKPIVTQRIMFIKENLGIIHTYYVSIAKGDKTEDEQYLIKIEMKYLPLLGEGDGDNINVGQNAK
jgi:hypothetical protein